MKKVFLQQIKDVTKVAGNVVERAVDETKDAMEEVGDFAAEIGEAARAASQEAAKKVGSILSKAFAELRAKDPEAAAAAGVGAGRGNDGDGGLNDGLELMKQTGAPLADDLLKRLEKAMSPLIRRMKNEDVEKLQDTLGKAASVLGGTFLALFHQLSKAVSAAIQEGRELTESLLPAISAAAMNVGKTVDATMEAAGDAFEDAGDAVATVKIAAGEIYDSPQVR